MQIAVLGINYKCGDVALREKIAQALQRELPFPHVLLATCSRSEIYFHSPDLAETHSLVLNILKEEIPPEFEHKLYTYFGVDCFAHLAKVTSGLDSALLGETEIQGQVKTAYERAIKVKTACLELHFLFQKSLQLAKQIRTEYPPFRPLWDLEETVFELCLGKKSLLFIGLSEINSKLIKGLKNHFPVTITNRTELKALRFAQEEKILYCPWKLGWQAFDVLIFATASPLQLLNQADLKKSRTSLILDLSVPRNVDPTIRLPLINIDQINARIEKRRESLLPTKLDELIQTFSLRYSDAFQTRRLAKSLFTEDVLVV